MWRIWAKSVGEKVGETDLQAEQGSVLTKGTVGKDQQNTYGGSKHYSRSDYEVS